MTQSERAILERLELKLDVAILMSDGMSRADAEARVYTPKLAQLLTDLNAELRGIRAMLKQAAP